MSAYDNPAEFIAEQLASDTPIEAQPYQQRILELLMEGKRLVVSKHRVGERRLVGAAIARYRETLFE